MSNSIYWSYWYRYEPIYLDIWYTRISQFFYTRKHIKPILIVVFFLFQDNLTPEPVDMNDDDNFSSEYLILSLVTFSTHMYHK